MCGCISIIELLQFTTIHSFGASLGKAVLECVCHQDTIKQTNTHNCIKIEKFQDTASGSRLIEQTLLSWTCNTLSSLTYCL